MVTRLKPEHPMADQTSDLYQLKKGTAVLAVCIVRTLEQFDPSARNTFLEMLDRAYSMVRDEPGNPMHQMELLSWTRELLTGWNLSEGQGEPFLKD
jgi:hypothetical protein